MEGILSDGMCRCCATEGTFKDFQVPYQWMGVEEIYANMLKDCFDITLSISEDINNGGVCEVCITQLRNACNFKLQVQKTEEKFKKKMEEGSFKADSIKMEVTRFDGDDSNLSADDFSSQEYEVPIKEEKVEEKPKKRQAASKASTSKAKKAKTTAGEPSAKRTGLKKLLVAKDETRPRKSTITFVSMPSTRRVKLVVTKRLKRDEFRENMKEILLNTNATPIRCKGGIGYACCFCTDQFLETSDLKRHTIQEHDENAKSNFLNGVPLNDLYVKLDITDLKCACGTNLQTIEDLVQHLEVKHQKVMHTSFLRHVVPFKFNEGLRCAICERQFNNFKLLMEHMNLHYRNHVCEVCGAGFVNRKTFTAHTHRHEKGSHPCKVCAKVFASRVRKMEHERAIHVHGNMRNKCGYCGEKFKDYTKKNDHEVKLHGAKPLVLACNACDKVFDNQRSLTVHTKTHHMVQRK